MNLGYKIREVRQKHNIKQEELATFLRISQGQLSKIESGQTFVTFEQVINIASYTKTSLYQFLPEDIEKIQQLDFAVKMEEYHQITTDQRDTIKQLLTVIRGLELELKKFRDVI